MMEVEFLTNPLKNAYTAFPSNANEYNIDQIIQICQKQESLPPSVICLGDAKSSNWVIATDLVRSIPVFYTIIENRLLVSNTTKELIPYIKYNINQESIVEFLSCGYSTGENTLLSEIKQLQAGSFLWVNKDEFQTGFYFRYLSKSITSESFNSLKYKLKDVFELVFKDLIHKLNGRQVVIPLSGGYDSRLIVYWLCRLNYTNIQCFTYGRPRNKEVKNASKTASELKVNWLFLDYTQMPINDYIHSQDFEDYYPYMANYSSMFFMQDYFAVKYLKENKLITKDAVFLPGHSGDFLGGSHLYPNLGDNLSSRDIIQEIYRKHFTMVQLTDIEQRLLLNSIKKNIITGYPNYEVFEDYNMRERQSKFIVNSARIYPFFGYDYFLPLWDIRLIHFFRIIPFEHKLFKKLYNKVSEELFETKHIKFYPELHEKILAYIIQLVKHIVISIFPWLVKFKKLPLNDPICYCEITESMKDSLIKNGEKTRKVNSYNGYIVQWYIYQISKNSQTNME